MEPISLGLAVASVLPLPIELFKQSIQAYKLFIEARESEMTMSYFATRLLIEYDRLVQWGKASGLFATSRSDTESWTHDTSSPFHDPNHVALVQRILRHIKDLFEDSASLASKYGINIVRNRAIAPADQKLLGGTGSPSPPDKSTSKLVASAKVGFTKLKWAIKDKEGFERLLKDLTQLNDNLHSLHSSDIIRAIVRDTVASVIRQVDHRALGSIRRLNNQDFEETNALVPTVAATDGGIDPFPYEVIPTTASAAYMVQQTKKSRRSRTNPLDHSSGRGPLHESTLDSDEDLNIYLQESEAREHKQDPTFSISYSAIITNHDRMSSLTSDQDITGPHGPGAYPWSNLERQGLPVQTASRIRIWDRTDGLEPTRVFLEQKKLMTGSVSRNSLYKNFLRELNNEMHSLEDLVRLLNEDSTAAAFRALRCIGMTERKHNRVTLIYELPSNVDHSRDPLTLAAVLEPDIHAAVFGSRRGAFTANLPSLTKRFQLARTLISAMYQIHSASWMHREFSAKNVMFFYNQPQSGPSETPPAYDLSVPYIDGFKNSRSAVYGLSPFNDGDKPKLPGFLAKKVYRHPAYLLHKSNRPRSSPRRSCHRFRHDYYALGLVLLEIGLWSPLRELELDVLFNSSESSRHQPFGRRSFLAEPVDGGTESSSTVRLSEEWLTKTTEKLYESLRKIDEHDTWEKLDAEGWPAGLGEAIIPDLRRAIQDEQIQDIAATPEDEREREDHLRNLCFSWADIYPVEMLRQSAIRKTEGSLAGYMGEKYRDIVLRCLKSDFGISGAASEEEWLHEFNWQVVRNIEQCSV